MENDKTKIADFFGSLLHSRDMTHLMHLSTGSYAEHVALGSFYDDVLGLTDQLIEAYQGCYGKITIIIPTSKAYPNSVEYMEDLKEYITNTKDICFSTSFLLNIVDEILALIAQTIYKLKFLK